MPFRGSQYCGAFAPEDLQVLQAAYNRSCAMLDRCPTTHEARNQLARAIIRTYESGEHDPEIIAAIAARVELMRS